jgi:hypothetical protein
MGEGRICRLEGRAARARGRLQPKIIQARPIRVAAKARTTGTNAISIRTGLARDRNVAVKECAEACLPRRPAPIARGQRRNQHEERDEHRAEKSHDREVKIDSAFAGEGSPHNDDEPKDRANGDLEDNGMNASRLARHVS